MSFFFFSISDGTAQKHLESLKQVIVAHFNVQNSFRKIFSLSNTFKKMVISGQYDSFIFWPKMCILSISKERTSDLWGSTFSAVFNQYPTFMGGKNKLLANSGPIFGDLTFWPKSSIFVNFGQIRSQHLKA